jgi:hypothetical protein
LRVRGARNGRRRFDHWLVGALIHGTSFFNVPFSQMQAEAVKAIKLRFVCDLWRKP